MCSRKILNKKRSRQEENNSEFDEEKEPDNTAEMTLYNLKVPRRLTTVSEHEPPRSKSPVTAVQRSEFEEKIDQLRQRCHILHAAADQIKDDVSNIHSSLDICFHVSSSIEMQSKLRQSNLQDYSQSYHVILDTLITSAERRAEKWENERMEARIANKTAKILENVGNDTNCHSGSTRGTWSRMKREYTSDSGTFRRWTRDSRSSSTSDSYSSLGSGRNSIHDSFRRTTRTLGGSTRTPVRRFNSMRSYRSDFSNYF